MSTRKRSSGPSLNLDSLLDTLTNVVGFLVILMALMQLGVGDAIQKIQTAMDDLLAAATPEGLDSMRTTVVAAAEQHAEAQARLAHLDEQLEMDLQAINTKRSPAAAAAPPVSVDIEPLKAQLAELERQAKEVETQLSAAVAETARLESLLAESHDDRSALPAEIVQLPNPRAPPEGSLPVYFFCRGGQVIPLDLPGLQDRAKKALVFVMREPVSASGALQRVDCDKLSQHFEQNNLGDQHFRLRTAVANFVPYLIYERRKGAGDSVEQLKSAASAVARALRSAAKQKRYARFIVWPDSFSAYLAARQLADKVGLPAGWEATAMASEWTGGFPANLRCRGAPAPEPVSPTALQPAAPAQPEPVDVVD